MKNLRRPWTPDEDARLRSMLEAGISTTIAAAKLKRTKSALRGRASMLQLVRPIRTRGRAEPMHRI
jgi:hypothetical protein